MSAASSNKKENTVTYNRVHWEETYTHKREILLNQSLQLNSIEKNLIQMWNTRKQVVKLFYLRNEKSKYSGSFCTHIIVNHPLTAPFQRQSTGVCHRRVVPPCSHIVEVRSMFYMCVLCVHFLYVVEKVILF